jgi:hypothetical protein
MQLLWAGLVLEAYATGSSWREFNGSFFRQSLQVVFGCIDRTKPEFGSNFSPCRRETGLAYMATDKAQDLLLSAGKCSGHGDLTV